MIKMNKNSINIYLNLQWVIHRLHCPLLTSTLLSSLARRFLSFLGVGDLAIGTLSSSIGLSVLLELFGVDKFTGPFTASPFSDGASVIKLNFFNE